MRFLVPFSHTIQAYLDRWLRKNYNRVIFCCPEFEIFVLLHNRGFCNDDRTDFALTSLPFVRKPILCRTMTKNITIFIYLIFYHREMVKLDHFNTVLWCGLFKIHRFVAVPRSFGTSLCSAKAYLHILSAAQYLRANCSKKRLNVRSRKQQRGTYLIPSFFWFISGLRSY